MFFPQKTTLVDHFGALFELQPLVRSRFKTNAERCLNWTQAVLNRTWSDGPLGSFAAHNRPSSDPRSPCRWHGRWFWPDQLSWVCSSGFRGAAPSRGSSLVGRRRTVIGRGGGSGPVTPLALLSSPAMFAGGGTRSGPGPAPLGCTLSSHYFCFSNSSINYAEE